MMRYNVGAIERLMKKRGLKNANQLKEFAGLTVPTAYKVLRGEQLERIEVATLEALATAFKVKNPFTLLEYTP